MRVTALVTFSMYGYIPIFFDSYGKCSYHSFKFLNFDNGIILFPMFEEIVLYQHI